MAETTPRKTTLSFIVNGKKKRFTAYPMARLLDVLREEALCTGVKEGCGEGECGACSVEVDGILVNSCLVPFAQMSGRKVTTIEGLAKGNSLHPMQQAFIECGGAQCGICTPGMIMSAVSLLKAKPNATEKETREWLAGNLCRCTGYAQIVDSVMRAKRQKRSNGKSSPPR